MFNRLNKVAVTLAATLVLGIVAFAQGGVEQKVSFYMDGKIGNELVKKGAYTVMIPEAEKGTIEIKVGKKVVTAEYTKRENPTDSNADKMTYRENTDGTRTITSITPRGRNFTLVIAEAAGSVAKQQ
jgi:hypothetical protein